MTEATDNEVEEEENAEELKLGPGKLRPVCWGHISKASRQTCALGRLALTDGWFDTSTATSSSGIPIMERTR